MAIGIIGYGTVGRATARLFKDIVIYDPPKGYDEASALERCDVLFACLPTPTTFDGRCDLKHVYEAIGSLAPRLSHEQVVAIRSTVPPGTVRRLQGEFANTHFVSNPEFLRAHRIEEDTLRPRRVVIGGDSVYARQVVLRAYHARLGRQVPYLVTDSITAEFIKYTANAFLATKIVFGREIREAAERIGANHHDVVKAMSLDPRIGGGEEWWLDGLYDECLPKDLDAFITWLRSREIDRELLQTVSQLGRPAVNLVE